MRNIGGSVGIAVMTTLLARRQQFHQNRLIEHLLPGQRAPMNGCTSSPDSSSPGHRPATASRRALGALYGMVQQQAAMLSFVEAFKIMAVVFLAMIPMVFLLKDPKHNQGAKRGHATPQAASTIPEEAPAELVHM